MALTLSDIKKCLLCVLYLTHYENVSAGRLVSYMNDGGYRKYMSYGNTPVSGGYHYTPPYESYYGTPTIGGYYYTSPPPLSPPLTQPPPPKKTKKSSNALALGLGLGLGLGVPSLIAGVGYWIYKHPSVLPWMWRPL